LKIIIYLLCVAKKNFFPILIFAQLYGYPSKEQMTDRHTNGHGRKKGSNDPRTNKFTMSRCKVAIKAIDLYHGKKNMFLIFSFDDGPTKKCG
jgi:hypothetical protein